MASSKPSLPTSDPNLDWKATTSLSSKHESIPSEMKKNKFFYTQHLKNLLKQSFNDSLEAQSIISKILDEIMYADPMPDDAILLSGFDVKTTHKMQYTVK
jgi:hypothetical protein